MTPSPLSLSLSLLASTALSSANLVNYVRHERSYNDVDFFEFSSSADLSAALFSDEGGRANTNLLLGIAGEECIDLMKNPSFRGFQRHAGGKTVASATLPLSEAPVAITQRPRTQCAELYYYPKGTSLDSPPTATYSQEFDYETLQSWQKKIIKKEARFYNDFDFPIELYWNDEAVKSVHVGTVQPHSNIFQNTFVGHMFSARRLPEAGEVSSDALTVDYTVYDGIDYHFNSKNRLETCDFEASTSNSKSAHFDYDDKMVALDVQCDDMALRLEKFKLEVLHSKRLGLNYVQPTHIPGLTPMGFEKRRLPAETFSWLRTWYDQVKAEGRINKTESSAGPCMNQLDSPSVMHMITPTLKTRMATELRPILEDWYGQGSLKMTSIYGVRKYTDGSVLRMHVDTANTHVISAIINVDQDVDEPWRLLILDHEENEHWITMEPGDMVLYESAKMLHGRPEPMKGERYENIFLHYMPTSGWNYY